MQTGVLLSTLTSMREIFSWSTLAQMTGVAVVALLPALLKRGQKKT